MTAAIQAEARLASADIKNTWGHFRIRKKSYVEDSQPFLVQGFLALLNANMNYPHPQPFSRRRRELKLLFPLLWERARERAA
ncbi:hypothetical protein BST81_10975 [Leptolyngbya sp. 'hensonii']|nr:hypothetical protein BST81_10975 [Leptolyngbya sp. 'hensonii']